MGKERATSRRPVAAVVFDAVGTLITPDPAAGIVYHRVGRRYGSRKSKAEIIASFGRAFRAATRGAGSEPHRTSEAIERAFWREVVQAVFSELPNADAERCFDDLFEYFSRPEAWRVYPDVRPAVQALGSNLKVAVASNFDARMHGVFEGLPELSGIAPRFVSSEIGWRKPDRRFFGGVCRGLGLEPGRVLYVGDEEKSDVAAAVDAGLRAVLVRREGPAGPGVVTDLSQLPGLIAPTSDGDGT